MPGSSCLRSAMPTGWSEWRDMFRIEMLPAYHGDSIWIEWGDARKPNRLLIDAGLAGTYNTILARAGERCRFELFCVTHVDQDHVEGAVRLLANLPKGIDIGEVWFNGWDQITGARLGPTQGEKLGAAIVNLAKVPWNACFHGKAVMATDKGGLPSFEFQGLTLTVLSPRKEELDRLKPVWERECAKAGLIPGDIEAAEEALKRDRLLRPKRLGESVNVETLAEAKYEPDSSVANGSSIALLAEYNGKVALLGGDAHSEVLESGIQRLLAQCGKRKLAVDAYKMPHHGSRYNNSPTLIEKLDCPRWLISTNGDKFQHPDRETIARVLVAHKKEDKELYFNYRSEYNDIWDRSRLKQDWRYTVAYPKSAQGGIKVDL